MSPGVKRRRISWHQYGKVLLLSNVCPYKSLQDYNEQLTKPQAEHLLSAYVIINFTASDKIRVCMLYVCNKIFTILYNVLRMSHSVKRRRISDCSVAP